MIAMGLNTEEEGSPMAFFRRGYKVGSIRVVRNNECCAEADNMVNASRSAHADLDLVGRRFFGGGVA